MPLRIYDSPQVHRRLVFFQQLNALTHDLSENMSVLKAYNEFESRVEHLKNRTLSKPERIKAMIDQKVGKITKKEIMDAHPDISKTTVERTLADLVKSEYIAKVGSGPATGYVKI